MARNPIDTVNLATTAVSRRSFLRLAALAGIQAAAFYGAGFAGADEASTSSDERWSAFGEDYPSLEYCQEAAVVDEDGNTLFSYNGSRSMAMASTTKIMSAIVALESGVPLDTAYTVSDVVDTVYGQEAGFAQGEQTTLNDLLHALLIYSGNDAAVCLAECVGGTVDNFVYMMNQKASELGLQGTHYINPHGLDEDGHYSTPLDLITLARHACQYPVFSSIVSSTSVTVRAGGQDTTLYSTDALTNVYPGMRGIKTGYTYAAGMCFVGRCTRGGKTLFTCVLGCSVDEGRWQDTRNLLDWAFSHYPETQVSTSGSLVSYDPLSTHFGWCVTTAQSESASLRDAQGMSARQSSSAASLTDPGQVTSNVTWSSQSGTPAASSTAKAQGVVFESHAFGPLVSNLFY